MPQMVSDHYGKPEQSFDGIAQEVRGDEGVDEPDHQQRENKEDANPDDEGNGQGHTHGPTGKFLGLPFILAQLGQVGRLVQGLHAEGQGFGQDGDAPQKPDAAQGAGEEGVERAVGVGDGAVSLPHRQAVAGAAPDHHSLDDGLSAVDEVTFSRQGNLGQGWARELGAPDEWLECPP